MTLTDIGIDALTESDLKAAIAAGLRQSGTIAFAPEAYRLPFIRDVSSLANSEGGLVLIGIAEKNGVATGLAPLTGNPETELQQLVLRLRDITPPVPGVLLNAVTLKDGGIVVALHVPKSQQPPHRVPDPRDPRSTLVFVRDKGVSYELHPRALTDGWFG